MKTLRYWSVRHARFLECLYNMFMGSLIRLHPLFKRIGYQQLEAPVELVESRLKGALFDCRMCGNCVLNSTGMSCPMNCPKQLRNGPCGGVRQDGACELKPDMPCVWVAAYEGSQRMCDKAKIIDVLPALDHRLEGTSSWLFSNIFLHSAASL